MPRIGDMGEPSALAWVKKFNGTVKFFREDGCQVVTVEVERPASKERVSFKGYNFLEVVQRARDVIWRREMWSSQEKEKQ